MIFLEKQKGASAILITFLILGILLIISLGFSYIANLGIKTTREAGASIKAYQVADAGLEFAIELANNWSSIAPSNNYLCSYSGTGCELGSSCNALGDGQFCLMFLDSSDSPLTFADDFTDVVTIKAIGKVGPARRSAAVKIR